MVVRYGAASTSGAIGGPLTFSIEETVLPFRATERDAWRRGELQASLVPAVERGRSKYRNQHDNHYGEVLAMHHLLSLEQGWAWRYEDYYLFRCNGDRADYGGRLAWLQTPGRSVYRQGTRALGDIVGAEQMRALWEAAERYRDDPRGLKATEPDLIAYREHGPPHDLFAIEVKLASDTVKESQMLGLALMQAVLGCAVAVFRYLPAEEMAEPTRYSYYFRCCR